MGKKPYTLIWCITFLVVVVQHTLNLLKPHIQPFALYWLVVCSLSMLSVTFGAWGHILRTESRLAMKTLWQAFGITFVAMFYFTVISPHVGLQMSIYIYHNTLLLGATGWIILRYRETPLAAEIGTAMVYFVLCFFQFVAATLALMQGPESDPIYRTLYIYTNLIIMPAAFTGMGLFVVFILAADLSEEMKRIAMTDELTACLNRRGFYHAVSHKLKQLHKKQQTGALVYWDIDKFKSINDDLGHHTGDIVLASVASHVKSQLHKGDLIARLGGEEFVIIMMNLDIGEATVRANQLRESIERHVVIHRENPLSITASFGVVQLQANNQDIDAAIRKADHALYQAKNQGRNQVMVA